MIYKVLIEPVAAVNIEEAYLWIAEQSAEAATRWLHNIQQHIFSLAEMPQRCPIAPENDAFDEEIRQLLHESYRILFTILESEVHILHVRHGARLYIQSRSVQIFKRI